MDRIRLRARCKLRKVMLELSGLKMHNVHVVCCSAFSGHTLAKTKTIAFTLSFSGDMAASR